VIPDSAGDDINLRVCRGVGSGGWNLVAATRSRRSDWSGPLFLGSHRVSSRVGDFKGFRCAAFMLVLAAVALPLRVLTPNAQAIAARHSAPSGVPRIYAALIAPENIVGRVRFEGTGGHSMLMLTLSGQPAHQCGRATGKPGACR
jgi:hypothetical protein